MFFFVILRKIFYFVHFDATAGLVSYIPTTCHH